MKNHLTKASVYEYQASLFGAVFASLGVGVLVARYVGQTAALALVLVGIVMHGWGMYRVNKRSN